MVSTLKILVTYFTNLNKCKIDTGIPMPRPFRPPTNVFAVPDIGHSDNMTKDIVKNSISITHSNIRRSNVVKEVEKLKKNREERRQRQAEEKAEKEAFLQMAPGNPHWEFLNMIQ